MATAKSFADNQTCSAEKFWDQTNLNLKTYFETFQIKNGMLNYWWMTSANLLICFCICGYIILLHTQISVAHNLASPTWAQAGDENIFRLRIGERMYGRSLQDLWGTFEKIESQHSKHHIWYQPTFWFHRSVDRSLLPCVRMFFSILNFVFILHSSLVVLITKLQSGLPCDYNF